MCEHHFDFQPERTRGGSRLIEPGPDLIWLHSIILS